MRAFAGMARFSGLDHAENLDPPRPGEPGGSSPTPYVEEQFVPSDDSYEEDEEAQQEPENLSKYELRRPRFRPRFRPRAQKSDSESASRGKANSVAALEQRVSALATQVEESARERKLLLARIEVLERRSSARPARLPPS